MSADKPFVSAAIFDAFHLGQAQCQSDLDYCCELAGIDAAFRAKSVEITDEQIIHCIYPIAEGKQNATRVVDNLRRMVWGVE